MNLIYGNIYFSATLNCSKMNIKQFNGNNDILQNCMSCICFFFCSGQAGVIVQVYKEWAKPTVKDKEKPNIFHHMPYIKDHFAL